MLMRPRSRPPPQCPTVTARAAPRAQVLAGRSARLESLDLSYCSRVGDAGAGALRSLSALRRLDLTWTAVTVAGLHAVAAGLPGLDSLRPGAGDAPTRGGARAWPAPQAAAALAA